MRLMREVEIFVKLHIESIFWRLIYKAQWEQNMNFDKDQHVIIFASKNF